MYNIQSISIDDLRFHTHQINNETVEYFYNLMCSYKSPLPIVFYVDFHNRVLSHHSFVMALIRFINVFQPDNKKVYCFKIDPKLFDKLSGHFLIEVDNKNFDSLLLDVNRLISVVEDLEFLLSDSKSNEDLHYFHNEFSDIKKEIKQSAKLISMAPKPKIKYNIATEFDSFYFSNPDDTEINNPCPRVEDIKTTPTINSNSSNTKTGGDSNPTNVKIKNDGDSNPIKKNKNSSKSKSTTKSNKNTNTIVLDIISKIKSKQKIKPPNNFSDILRDINNLDLLYNLCKTIKGKRRLSIPDKQNKSELINFVIQHISYRM